VDGNLKRTGDGTRSGKGVIGGKDRGNQSQKKAQQLCSQRGEGGLPFTKILPIWGGAVKVDLAALEKGARQKVKKGAEEMSTRTLPR